MNDANGLLPITCGVYSPMKCPRCRRGPMFKDSNAYRKFSLKHIFDMHDNCPVCNQKYDLSQASGMALVM